MLQSHFLLIPHHGLRQHAALPLYRVLEPSMHDSVMLVLVPTAPRYEETESKCQPIVQSVSGMGLGVGGW